MEDDPTGIKEAAAEVSFLIRDLHVKKFIDDIIHFHVTLDADLEIYGIGREHKIHRQDLEELKILARAKRKAYNRYRNAAKEATAGSDIVAAGRFYIEKVREVCELVLNPLWGRFDRVTSALPQESRSYLSRSGYPNYLRWICGVYYRIEHFLQEMESDELYEEFDIAEEVYEFTNNVVYGYVTEKSSSKVEILFENAGSAVVGGNRPRYRRMYFNVVKGAVDAMLGQRRGRLSVRVQKSGDYVYLQVEDNGCGMSSEEIDELLNRSEEPHEESDSMGFAFVRKTVGEFGGRLSVKSEPGRGTTVTIGVPNCHGKAERKIRRSKCEKYFHFILGKRQSGPNVTVLQNPQKINISEVWQAGVSPEEKQKGGKGAKALRAVSDREKRCGAILYDDYKTSQARYPGCLFAISVNYRYTLDFFCHRAYDRYIDINHEDLSPMFFEATVRGRLERNEEEQPEIVLKPPCSVREFFEFKNVEKEERCAGKFRRMMRDEYILIARKLVGSGLPPDFAVRAANIRHYFEAFDSLFQKEPFPLSLLAAQKLTIEE